MGKPRVSPAKVLIEKRNDRVRKEKRRIRLRSGQDTGTVPDKGWGNGGWRE